MAGGQKARPYFLVHTISTDSFILEGAGGGGLPTNDHEFPFAGDVELLRRSLSEDRTPEPARIT